MNGKRFADIMICSLSVAVIILGYIYMETGNVRKLVCGTGCVFFLIFFLLAVIDNNNAGKKRKKRRHDRTDKGIHGLVLLDENDEEISEWNIAGKISLVIGRDGHKENVDINLMNTAFAGMVDRQHAVMNYTAGQWYIEDLDSANGIRIKKKKDNKIYEVSGTQPCLVEKGDIVFIGLTKLEAK